MSVANGRTEPDSVINFGDGCSYLSKKMETAYQKILEKETVKPPKNPALAAAKKEDVELIVQQFEIPRVKAQQVLVDNDGDVLKALLALIHS